MKYIFKQIDDISGEFSAETTVEFSADSLPDILQHFEMFLRGSGFHPSGTLDFVDEDDTKFEPDEEYHNDLEEHEWTKTLRNDSEWPFPRNISVQKQEEKQLSFPWNGVSGQPSQWKISDEKPNYVMDWTAANLIRPPKMKDICSVCKIDVETMLNHECWDVNCPKGKDAD